jgi:hypothetical protein
MCVNSGAVGSTATPSYAPRTINFGFFAKARRSVCRKRCFESVKHARAAHRSASFRIRPYWCEDCRAWHVTANEKRRGEYDPDDYPLEQRTGDEPV